MKFSQLWMLAKRKYPCDTRGECSIIAFSQLQAPDRVPLSRRADPAIEENGLGFVVSDEKEKRRLALNVSQDGEDFSMPTTH